VFLDRLKLENSNFQSLAGRRIFHEEVEVHGEPDRIHFAPGLMRARRSRRCAGISEATFYNWRAKYGGLTPSEMKWLRQLEEENSKLKKLVADLSLDKAMLQDVIRRKI
jgi:hypothetical protein